MELDLQQKSFSEPFEVKALDEDGTFEGYCSTYELDQDNEIIDRGAFKRTLDHSKGIVPILWAHNRAEPVGWGLSAEPDDHGVKVKGKLLIDTEKGKYAQSFLKAGLSAGGRVGLSIGFMVPRGGSYIENGVTHFREVALKEWSIVVFACNLGAYVTSAKGAIPYQDLPLADDSRAWDAAAATARVRTWAGGTDKDKISWAKYRRAFLWYDTTDAQNFGSYKLPIADAIDGKLTAVPRGVMAAAGGHGVNSSDIPDADKAKVRAAINRYYKKMGKDSPFTAPPKGGSMKINFKADDFSSNFSQAVALSDLQDLRWTMESALRDTMYSICEDEEMAADEKKTACMTSQQQYCTAMCAWWCRYIDITAEPDDADGQMAAAVEALSKGRAGAKEGAAISEATGKKIMAAKGYIAESMGHASMSAKAKSQAIGVLDDLSQGYAWNDVNKPNPVGGGKSAAQQEEERVQERQLQEQLAREQHAREEQALAEFAAAMDRTAALLAP